MPDVSVIIPCYNEQDTIQLLLGALYAQTYPRSQLEVVIADGHSEDCTRAKIEQFQQAHADLALIVVENPRRSIPAGLNCAIEAARGEYLIRLDAHSVPQADYIERCVQALEQGLGSNVGGVWEIRPGGESWQARSIALAAAHPLGVGDARYRYTDRPQQVDTVPFGAFHRQTVKDLGGFNENLLTNEDYELNVRLRQAGKVIWLDPMIRSVYFARPTFADLARQYWRYGYWKARMLRRYPHTIRWRQALPPVFVLSLPVLMFLSVIWPLVGWLFVIELAAYALILLAIGVQVSLKRQDWSLVLGIPLAIAIMHLSWGSAFLWSLIVR